ncbi:MAG: gliding motility-associated C-terminal domain-containing protein [Bacteroidaceae bacterium]|nr:gliding motility-associated C-terminal domain-containing protein [Bacteroidaceae bacterium]
MVRFLKRSLFAYGILFACACFAQPVAAPFLVLTDPSGNQDTLRAGETGVQPYQAPLSVEFCSNISNPDGVSVFPEWKVMRSYSDKSGSGSSETYLVRKNPDTEFEFTDYGSFTVSFSYTYSGSGQIDTEPGADVENMVFTIDNSSLHVPNAFSPNGDGYNDIFLIKAKSIVSIQVAIFDRYGRQIKSGTEQDMPYKEDSDGGYFECWDGTIGGRTAPDGVYYINVKAIGAGGYRYNRKSDINLLTGVAVQ